MKKIVWVYIFILQFLALGVKMGLAIQAEPMPHELSNLISARLDWNPQDYENSRGITSVLYNKGEETMVLYCDLVGKDWNRSQGEIVLDLKYVAELEANVPVNMTGRLIEAEIEIPAGLVGSPSSPNCYQVFVKDQNFKCQYGAWGQCNSSGIIKINVQPDRDNIPQGFRETDFDPAYIRSIGIKIGLHPDSTQQYNGQVIIRKITVTPPLSLNAPPHLPINLPLPFMKADSDVEKQWDGFYIDGNKWFAMGGNWRMIQYRQNFGSSSWFPNGGGVSAHQGFLATKMEWFRRAGITLLRVGVLDDGFTMFDLEGNVTGYNDIFKKDIALFLTLANRYHIKVEFLLLDCLAAGKAEKVRDGYIQGRRQIIEDPITQQLYIEDFLKPFLTEFGNDPVVFGFDIINEPEWFIAKKEGGGWVKKSGDKNTYTTPIPLDTFKDFVVLCRDTIRELAPGKFITVGVSCTKRSILNNLALDYHALHYYPPMGDFAWNINQHYRNKPWSLQEFPANGDIFAYFYNVYEQNGAGAEVWNLSPNIDEYAYPFAEEERKLQEIRRFADYLDGLPLTISLSDTSLNFRAKTDELRPKTQVFFINQSGRGLLEWRISTNVPWLTCTPDSGTGTTIITVSVNPEGLNSGNYAGIITVSDMNAIHSSETLSVRLFIEEPDAFENRSIIRFR